MKTKATLIVILSAILLIGCGLQSNPVTYSAVNIKDYANDSYSVVDESMIEIIDASTPLGFYESGILYPVIVTAVKKETVTNTETGSKGIVCSYMIESVANKEIKRVDGVLIIKSKDGKENMRIETSFDNIRIPAKQSITVNNYGFDIDESVKFQKEIYDSELSSLDCEFKIEDVEYVNTKIN
jgi:outer membrane lipoprotein SlyB